MGRGAENDGYENDGPWKLQNMKLQDMKLQVILAVLWKIWCNIYS